MVRPVVSTFARWGTPPKPASLSDAAKEFLAGIGTPQFPSALPVVADIPVARSRLTKAQHAEMAAILGAENVSTSDADRVLHSAGCSLTDYLELRRKLRRPLPDAVVRPSSRDEVNSLLMACSAAGITVVPFGGGTSVVGGLRGFAHTKRSIAVAFDRMAGIRSIDPVNSTVTVEPGITGPDLERALAEVGLLLGHLPQSWERATIGGYAATRSAGQNSTGYGRSDEMIEEMVVATPVGEIVLGRVHRSAAGPDLRQLFIGSEGVFGIITEITLRVRRAPEVTKYEGLMFPDFFSGETAFRELAQQGLTSEILRLSDEHETITALTMSGPSGRAKELFDKYLELRKVDGGCLAILGWEGHNRRLVSAKRSAAWKVLKAHGAVSLGSGVGESWRKHRFEGPFLRDELLDLGYIVETLETAAHWRQAAELKAAVAQALEQALAADGVQPFVMCHISHVYETSVSLYFTVISVAKSDPVKQWAAAKKAACDAIEAHAGTITHHHGVGADHAPWLTEEIGPRGVAVLRAVKAAVDPEGILNPGVLLPPQE